MNREVRTVAAERREMPKKATTFDLIPSGAAFFGELKDRIDSDTTSVRLQSFLLSNDPEVGGPILASLEQSARRGRNVRVMADGMYPNFFLRLSGTKLFSNIIGRMWPEVAQTRQAITHIHELQEEGLPIAFRNPIERKIRHSPFQRDHTKNIVIDAEDPSNAVSYIGGRNVWGRDLANRDFMVRINGELTKYLRTDFDRTWQGVDIYQRTYKDADGNLLVSDVRRSDEIPHMVVERMKQAQKRIWLETPYYDRFLLSKLLIQLHKERPDLDIRFVTPAPKSNNHPNYQWSSERYTKELANAGIPVYLIPGSLSHAKSLLIDDEAIIGSSNFSQRHILGGMNAEIEVFTKDPDFITQIEGWFASGFTEGKLREKQSDILLDHIYRAFRDPLAYAETKIAQMIQDKRPRKRRSSTLTK